MIRARQLICFCSFVLFVTACGSQYEKSEELLFASEGWARSDSLQVHLEAKDTTTRYDLLMDLVHSRDYPYQNIYLAIQTTFPSGKTVQDHVNVNVMDKSGYLFGRCGNERCELRVWLQKDVRFRETGQYSLSISQHTRQDTLPGIYSAAFRLEQHESKRR